MGNDLFNLYQSVNLATAFFSILISGIGAMMVLSHGRATAPRNLIFAGLILECVVVAAHAGFQIMQMTQAARQGQPPFGFHGVWLIQIALRVLGLGASLLLVAGVIGLVKRNRTLELLHEEQNSEYED